MNKFNNKPLAIFDLDGTFFRDSLFIVVVKAMCDQTHDSGFSSCRLDHHKAIQEAELAWKNRTSSYNDYLEVVFNIFYENIIGIKQTDLEELSKRIIRNRYNQVYIFTRELFNVCKDKYHLVALTGSQVEMVNVFRELWPFDTVLGTVMEVDKNGVFTGGVISRPMEDKRKALLDLVDGDESLLKGSIGIGDSVSDMAMLKLVDKKILFNASSNLRLKAGDENLEHIAVVERKDLAWVIQKDSVQTWTTRDLESLRKNIQTLIK